MAVENNYLREVALQIRQRIPEDALPPDGPIDLLFDIYAILALSKGENTTAKDVHNAWVAWMGTVHTSHQSIVPFDELPKEIADADMPFVQAIREVGKGQHDWLSPPRVNSPEERDQFFESYKVLVGTSEALVRRRQGLNTFFLTSNGFLATVLGILLREGGHGRWEAGGISIIAVVGAILCYSWRSLLTSYGQLNRGKFAVINEMEILLPADIFSAEWRALGEGRDPHRYKTFTSTEAIIPALLGVIYLAGALFAAGVALSGWRLR